jgi:hypoxanthine-DNA glycosylase
LERSEYYANPQNAFWRIAQGCAGGDVPDDYALRVAFLTESKVALWDVLAAATRSGSLDSAIRDDAIPNNFRAFFRAYPSIQLVCFNGATAARLYRRHVVPTLTADQNAITQLSLPSTSGAHAAMSPVEKRKRWSVVWGDNG